MSYTAICILVMALVTYIPRALPLVLIRKKIQNPFIQSFLHYVPYAVISALTFPGIFYFTSNIFLALIGTGTALLLAFFKQKLYVVALASVAVTFACSFFFF